MVEEEGVGEVWLQGEEGEGEGEGEVEGGCFQTCLLMYSISWNTRRDSILSGRRHLEDLSTAR